ncbi:serine/threonine protein kinase [bacterium]|nr:serine/threonine protein kinase [bacterium]
MSEEIQIFIILVKAGIFLLIKEIPAFAEMTVFLDEVVLKIASKSNRSAYDALKHEKNLYELLSPDSIPTIYGISEIRFNSETQLMLVISFRGEYNLKQRIMNRKTIDINSSLKTTILIVDALSNIHNDGIIHKNINPSNIIISKNNDLTIIDFGISSKFSQEDAIISKNNIFQGSIPYISSEQTGRMNRGIDYRTDYYSLGVTLYELFAGKVPFDEKDDLSIIHSHFAKKPVNPSKINPDIPSVISAIILKLMSKNPDDRYQGTKALKSDLRHCLTLLQSHKLEVACVFQNNATALKHLKECAGKVHTFTGTLEEPLYYFYECLTYAASYSTLNN